MATRSSVEAPANIDENADAILRVCSYHRRDFDLVVVRSRPHEMKPVEASLQAAFGSSPTAELGLVDRLPPELLWMVLRALDVRSYVRFRQVNRRARVLATELFEYKLVARHGLEGLRGLLRAGLAHGFTVPDLHRTLVTYACAACGAFGGLMFLFTAERCCFACLQSAARYRVLPVSTFAKLVGISPRRLVRLVGPGLRTVPGIYNMMKTPARRPKYLLCEEKAAHVLLASGNLNDDTRRKIRHRREQED
ncbi:F-box domain, Skp2-like protein [Niveomyces insectorum RCEF 264]|uniref:F-box domain, Skp2-like protein n=1 Tax=Niveomyces insectorum RCEF 264 TaxID=1081102 RepID=A0A167VBP6_9HYPO|nr:F-box domain, Skp2-like protein [Niveomyces insectorum RCEF 264]